MDEHDIEQRWCVRNQGGQDIMCLVASPRHFRSLVTVPFGGATRFSCGRADRLQLQDVKRRWRQGAIRVNGCACQSQFNVSKEWL
jgi:hypothetical protein